MSSVQVCVVQNAHTIDHTSPKRTISHQKRFKSCRFGDVCYVVVNLPEIDIILRHMSFDKIVVASFRKLNFSVILQNLLFYKFNWGVFFNAFRCDETICDNTQGYFKTIKSCLFQLKYVLNLSSKLNNVSAKQPDQEPVRKKKTKIFGNFIFGPSIRFQSRDAIFKYVIHVHVLLRYNLRQYQTILNQQQMVRFNYFRDRLNSLRLLGELKVQPGIHRPSVVNIFQHLKPLSRLKPYFMWSLPGLRERKFVRGVWVTCPRQTARPYMVKTLQISFLQNRKTDYLGSQYVL